MKKQLLAIVLFLSMSSAYAQLIVDDDGKVGIGSTNILTSALTVGPCNLYDQSSSNIGLAASPNETLKLMNVGVEGIVDTNSTYPLGYNFGVRGVAYPAYGLGASRNYGVAGIFSGTGSAGGTGIYGSSIFSSYYSGPTIQGKYAGYFTGNVNVTGNVTATQVLTTSDIRLKENIEEFGNDGNGRSAIDNLLGMTVLEYNLKDQGEYDVSEEASAILAKEHPEVLAELQKRKEEFTSKRHYGLSAQELLDIYPNLVRENAAGYYAVNYVELVPILIRCIQELKNELDELRASSGVLVVDGEVLATNDELKK